MEAEIQEFITVLNQSLSAIGFKKAGSRWVRRDPEITTRVFLVRDRWRSNQWYLEYEASILRLNPEGKTVWHLSGRQFSRNLAEKLKIEQILNLESPGFDGSMRQEAAKLFLNDVVVPFLLELGTLEGVNRLAKSGQLACLIRTELATLLQSYPIEGTAWI